MQCPNCSDVELEEQTVDGVGIDRCPTCRGIWLDMLELERLLESAPRDLLREDRAAAAERDTTAEEARRPCPKCRGGYLIKLNSRHRPGTIVDSCTVCHGTWLEAGELSRLSSRGLTGWLSDLFGG